MDFTRKQLIWGVILFGTLIGLNESLIGSLEIRYKSVVLSTITISMLTYARYYFPKTGTSLLITAVATLFKITSLGILFCRPTMLILLGTGYEVFASLIIGRKQFNMPRVILTCVFTSILTFTVFALFETYILKNEYWVSKKFTDYVFTKGPLTAVASALISVLGIYLIKPMSPGFIKMIVKKPMVSQLVLGCIIAVLWIAGYLSVRYINSL
jgi:hypothetical protein